MRVSVWCVNEGETSGVWVLRRARKGRSPVWWSRHSGPFGRIYLASYWQEVMRSKLLWGTEQYFGRPLSFCKDFVGSHTPGVWRRKELALWAVLASIFSVILWVLFIPRRWCSFSISHPGFLNYFSCVCFVSENLLFIWNGENALILRVLLISVSNQRLVCVVSIWEAIAWAWAFKR